ncbi:hypothetical protein Tco_0032601 [Tanacetum coccineum]
MENIYCIHVYNSCEHETSKRKKKTSSLVHYKKRRALLPYVPSKDYDCRMKQMQSLASSLTSLNLEFSNDLTYPPGMAPKSANQAFLENGGIQVLSKRDTETLRKCRSMAKRGEYPPLLIVYDSCEGYTVQADAQIKDMTLIAEYTGDVDYIKNRQNDDGDSMMTLLLATDPNKNLVICPDKRGNIARFISGINNYIPTDRARPILLMCLTRIAVTGHGPSRDPSRIRGRSPSRDRSRHKDRLRDIGESYNGIYSQGTRTKYRGPPRDIRRSRSTRRWRESESLPYRKSESSTSDTGHWKSRDKRRKMLEEDLAVPWSCEDVDPFTPRIRNFRSSRKTRMPNNMKTYDGSGDPEDHLKKKHVKDPVEIHNIKQRDGETIEEFMERFKVETRRMKGAPECMKISGFMHEVNNPELTKRLNEHVLKTLEDMMTTTTTFIRGETATASKKEVHTPWKP